MNTHKQEVVVILSLTDNLGNKSKNIKRLIILMRLLKMYATGVVMIGETHGTDSK